jgi:hypothetical protein
MLLLLLSMLVLSWGRRHHCPMHLDLSISFLVSHLQNLRQSGFLLQSLPLGSLPLLMLPSSNLRAFNSSDVCITPMELMRILLTLSDPLANSEFTRYVFNNPPPVESEDCLYLNVFAPSIPAAGASKPVLFWIFGGSLQFGNAGMTTEIEIEEYSPNKV